MSAKQISFSREARAARLTTMRFALISGPTGRSLDPMEHSPGGPPPPSTSRRSIVRRAEPLRLAAVTPDPGDARYFLDLLRRQLSQVYDASVLSSEGMRIYSTLDRRMQRLAAITNASANSHKLWAGTVEVEASAKTGAHHHGELESIIYVVSGKARMRWGDNLEFVAEAEAGDFIFVPPFVPHQEMNGSKDEPLHCVLVRSDQEPVVVNLDIQGVEEPETVVWVDAHHPAGTA